MPTSLPPPFREGDGAALRASTPGRDKRPFYDYSFFCLCMPWRLICRLPDLPIFCHSIDYADYYSIARA